MTTNPHLPDPDLPDRPARRVERTADQVRLTWLNRRREKIVEEIQRNRRGEYTVPTWVLAALLAAIIAGWVVLIVLS